MVQLQCPLISKTSDIILIPNDELLYSRKPELTLPSKLSCNSNKTVGLGTLPEKKKGHEVR